MGCRFELTRFLQHGLPLNVRQGSRSRPKLLGFERGGVFDTATLLHARLHSVRGRRERAGAFSSPITAKMPRGDGNQLPPLAHRLPQHWLCCDAAHGRHQRFFLASTRSTVWAAIFRS
jgi:hypothetical protein